MAITDEKYVSLTTFRKNGEPKPAPVWIVDAGNGKAAFGTASSSWKVKRLKNDSRVTVQASDSKGNPTAGAPVIEGTAEVLTGGAEVARVHGLVKKKYGIQWTMINLMGKAAKMIGKGSGTDSAIIMTLNES